jgi:hypothetical protein
LAWTGTPGARQYPTKISRNLLAGKAKDPKALVRITPQCAASFALTMLATTAHGDAYTFAEYQEIFARAGFQRSEFHSLPPTMQQAITSYKG